MPQPNPAGIFVSRLNKAGIPYAVTGAVASIIYGEPRLTNDLDLVVLMKIGDIEGFLAAFPPEEFYCPPAEVLRIEIKRSYRGHFNLIHHGTGMKADMYLAGEDELHRWALLHRKAILFETDQVWVAPPEYVILRKLEYYREGESEKHLRDIVGMLELSSPQIDFNELDDFVRRYGLEREWLKAREMAGMRSTIDL